MEHDILDKLWNTQGDTTIKNPQDIIAKAKKQRKRQQASSFIMSLTVIILIAYTIYVAPSRWNNFTLGLLLMIGSLTFRVLLEFGTIHRKQSRLLALDNQSYKNYLKKHYRLRLIINYLITPICISLYIYGFYLLLPYFKKTFSEGFYDYIVISGVASLIVVIAIIIHSIIKESRFLRQLKQY
ncbi:hypothetical protein [Winogradskyella sp.]|uniref:hypothetical protein n=1 Tax=Winogradskyella sp. TaxID=1883156 RepID=UPI003BAA3AC2